MATRPPTASMAARYGLDIYVGYAEPLALEDKMWVDRATAEIVRHIALSSAGQAPKTLGRDAPTLTPGASDDAAIMLLFLTPAFKPQHPCWDEVVRFHQAIAEGRRSADQLVVCELRRYPDELRMALPWASPTGTQTVALMRLFDSLTQVAYTAEDKVQENCWILSNDIELRLERLREAYDAVSTTLSLRVQTGKVDQAYLMEYSNSTTWSRTRAELLAEVGWVIHPERLQEDLSSSARRRELRQQRRRLLENCQGLLLVRGDSSDDLNILASDAMADLREVGEGVRPVCIDWVGNPAPDWPAYFKPQTVAATQQWVSIVKGLLSGEASDQ